MTERRRDLDERTAREPSRLTGEDLSEGPTPETRHPRGGRDAEHDTTEGPTPETRRAMRADEHLPGSRRPEGDGRPRTGRVVERHYADGRLDDRSVARDAGGDEPLTRDDEDPALDARDEDSARRPMPRRREP